MRQLLSQWGCTVLTASSGAAMLAQLANTTRAPDLIICDHRLHDTVTGMDVINSLRHEFNSDIPALLITGDTSPDKVKLLMATGLPVLHKPLQDHALHAAILKLVHARETSPYQKDD
ncbi:response regulator [Undibacterium sp. Di27W]|uniref:response regulator n=1 Tax=Undibacterium sp. Di27W TaxID=3413036 RepID=UPI003BF3380B